MEIPGIRHATGCLPLNLWKPSHGFCVQLEVRARHRAIARNIGTQDMREPARQKALDRAP
jgi:hypothetical protein